MIIEKIIDGFNVPIGSKVVSASRGVGSFLTFGLSFKCGIKEEKGVEFLLWIYLADWKIFECDKVILDSDQIDDESYSNVLGQFISSRLSNIDVNVDDMSVTFTFSGNLSIHLNSDLEYYEIDDDLFMLFDNKNGVVLSYSPERGVYSERSND